MPRLSVSKDYLDAVLEVNDHKREDAPEVRPSQWYVGRRFAGVIAASVAAVALSVAVYSRTPSAQEA